MIESATIEKPKKKKILRKKDTLADKKPIHHLIMGFYWARDSYLTEPSAKYKNSAKIGKAWLEVSGSEEFNDYAKSVFSRERALFVKERPEIKFPYEFEGEEAMSVKSVFYDTFIRLSLTGWTWYYKIYGISESLKLEESEYARLIASEYATCFLEKRIDETFFETYIPVVEAQLRNTDARTSAMIDTVYVDKRVNEQLQANVKQYARKAAFTALMVGYETFDKEQQAFVFHSDLARTETFLRQKLFLFVWTVLKDLNAKPIESLSKLQIIVPFGETDIKATVRRIVFVQWLNKQANQGKTKLADFKQEDINIFFEDNLIKIEEV